MRAAETPLHLASTLVLFFASVLASGCGSLGAAMSCGMNHGRWNQQTSVCMPTTCPEGQLLVQTGATPQTPNQVCLDFTTVQSIALTAADMNQDQLTTSYLPGGNRLLGATLTLTDGSTVKINESYNWQVWQSLDLTSSFGQAALSNDLMLYNAGDPTQNVGQSATLTVTLAAATRANPKVTASLTLTPDYSTAEIDGSADGGANSGDCGEKGQRGGDAASVTVMLKEATSQAGGTLVVAQASWADGSKQTSVFDPVKGSLTIFANGGNGGDGGDDCVSVGENCEACDHQGEGGSGGRGGKVTVLYDPAHPELKGLVKVQNYGGQGGADNGDPGPNGPDPVFKSAT
jgi:hypothetical protein